MAKAGITLKLEDFEYFLKDIEKAGKTMESAVESTMKQSAYTMDAELRKQLNIATQSSLASRMPKPKITKGLNRVTAHVGFEMDNYNPKNLSDAYKALFLNYGTPYRKKHGTENASNFISKAKKSASATIKKQQKETLQKILSRLK